jgi:uncharacterized protein YhfF/catechol 2,3-dioxygenase-like lactoylglutathione lyase family enzyme
MIKFKQLNHIQLCIPKGEEAQARVFYSEILGLKEIQKPETLLANGGLWYEIADIQLHIGTEDMSSNKSKRHPAFEVENLSLVVDYLKKKAVIIKEDIPIPNVNRISIFDPFGNRIELLEKINKESPATINFWNDFVTKFPKYEHHSIPVSDHFCNDKINTDICADLVLKGVKQASCGLKIMYDLKKEFFPEINQLTIITNWDHQPICVVKTIDLSFRKFKDIDSKWAESEGEGDQSLKQWKETHRDYFQKQLDDLGLVFTEEVELICERFEVVK